jgi:hypothetical protein
MWLKEKEFSIKLGGQTFINVPILIQFNGESLFTVRRHEETGEIGIDCDVFDEAGDKIASIRRNNMYPGDQNAFVVDRGEDHITLTDKITGMMLAQVRKNSAALPLELDVSVRTYLPDGRLLDAGPDSCTLGGLFFKGNKLVHCPVGIAINVPNLIVGKDFSNQEIHVDGKTFRRCRFLGCTLVFSATSPFALDHDTFDSTVWRFDGAASLTVEVMKTMHSGGFKDVIDYLIKEITSSKAK